MSDKQTFDLGDTVWSFRKDLPTGLGFYADGYVRGTLLGFRRDGRVLVAYVYMQEQVYETVDVGDLLTSQEAEEANQAAHMAFWAETCEPTKKTKAKKS